MVNVGAGLLAKAVYQSVHLALNHRFREQARSHIRFAVSQICVHKKNPRIFRYGDF